MVVLNGGQPGSLTKLAVSVPVNTTTSAEGFNIASHLRQGVEHSDGSSSPEIDRLLQDIDAVLRPPSPDSGTARNGDSAGSGRHSAPESLRSSHKPRRPKVAANFAGASSAGAVSVSRGASDLDNTAQNTGTSTQSKVLRTTGPDPTPSQSHSKQPDPAETVSDQPAATPTPDSRIFDPGGPDATRQHAAAAQIQQWYRGEKQRRLAEVQRLLQDKRAELNRSRTEEMHRMQSEVCSLIPRIHSGPSFLTGLTRNCIPTFFSVSMWFQAETRQHQDLERQQRRAAKMQAARKTAIEELQRKREERREETARIAQEEIVSKTVVSPNWQHSLVRLSLLRQQ